MLSGQRKTKRKGNYPGSPVKDHLKSSKPLSNNLHSKFTILSTKVQEAVACFHSSNCSLSFSNLCSKPLTVSNLCSKPLTVSNLFHLSPDVTLCFADSNPLMQHSVLCCTNRHLRYTCQFHIYTQYSVVLHQMKHPL